MMIDIGGLTLRILFAFLPHFQLGSVISGFFNGSQVEVEGKQIFKLTFIPANIAVLL